MTDSIPPRVPPWQDYALTALVLLAAFWALGQGTLTEASVVRLVVGAMTLQALLRRKLPPGGGLLALGASEFAGELVAVAGGA